MMVSPLTIWPLSSISRTHMMGSTENLSYMTSIWVIYDWYMTNIWLIYDWYMTDIYMTDIWLICDLYMTYILLVLVLSLAVTPVVTHFRAYQRPPDIIMVNSVNLDTPCPVEPLWRRSSQWSTDPSLTPEFNWWDFKIYFCVNTFLVKCFKGDTQHVANILLEILCSLQHN